MKKTALVIMAAGIGSRYGGGIKQLAKVGPSGEIIMDYSIHDALEAGFDKIVFIIRKDIEKDFREIIGNRIEKIADVEYVFQDLHDLPEGFSAPEGRTKPWGTGHAVLTAAKAVDCPFMVINADDYYGTKCYKLVHDYLVSHEAKENGVMKLCMAGFVLGNTLSPNGTVTRGVCKLGADNLLTKVEETYAIKRDGDKVVAQTGAGVPIELSENDVVSMNMWGLTEDVMDELKARFVDFLKGVKEGDLKAEYLLPSIIDSLIKEGKATVEALPTDDVWYGVTYQEDRQHVEDAIAELVKAGVYKEKLFG